MPACAFPRSRAALAALLAALAVSAVQAQTPAALEVEGPAPAAYPWLFRVNVDGGVAALGAYDGGTHSGGIPVEGEGTRLMWYPNKAAFRAGEVRSGVHRADEYPSPLQTTGAEWDDVNVGYHSVALGLASQASGDNAFAAGKAAYATGESTVAMGDGSYASGAASVALGSRAHTNSRQGSFVFGDRSSEGFIRAGVNNSATWRVAGGFRIYTASNLTTGVTIQSGASVSNWGQSSAVISTSTGALLTIGGVWQNASDSTRKHLFEEVSGEDVLARLRTLPIRRWSYRAEPASIRHMGPTSQDFRSAFELGGDERSIGTVDADGVALAAAKALEARTRQQAGENATLRAEVIALRARLDALEAERARPAQAALPALGLLALLGLTGYGFRRRRRPAQVT